jgi:hypothetical protein
MAVVLANKNALNNSRKYKNIINNNNHHQEQEDSNRKF